MADFPTFPTAEDFILHLAPEVHVQTIYNRFPASFGPVILAQSAYETGWGKYVRRDTNKGIYSYNLFNITKGNWKGPVLRVGSREFRVYKSFAESIADYFGLVTSASRYAAAVNARTPIEYVEAVAKGGWDPGNPDYANTWINVWKTLVIKTQAILESRR